MNKAMIDVAYDLMATKKKAVTFIKLWEEITQIIGFTQQQEEDNIAQFYSDLSLDERFVCIGENKWDLRARRTYNEVVIDTSEILIDESDDEEDIDYDSDSPTKSTDDDY